MTTAVRERIEDARRNWPDVVQGVEEHVRTAKRAIVDVRHAGEDAVAEAALTIRRRPLAAVGGAVAVGAVLGTLFGFAAGVFAARVRETRQ